MFSFLWKQTHVDSTFGVITGRGGKWKGTIQSRLFPLFPVTVWVIAENEHEWSEHRGHFQQVELNAGTIRQQIEEVAFETFKAYERAEGDKFDYPRVHSPEAMWLLLKPIEWMFVRTSKHFKSRVVLECGWPNPHDLVAYLDDTEHYLLDVEE